MTFDNMLFTIQDVTPLTVVYQDRINTIIALLFQVLVFLTGLVYQDGAFCSDPGPSVSPDSFVHIPDGFAGIV